MFRLNASVYCLLKWSIRAMVKAIPIIPRIFLPNAYKAWGSIPSTNTIQINVRRQLSGKCERRKTERERALTSLEDVRSKKSGWRKEYKVESLCFRRRFGCISLTRSPWFVRAKCKQTMLARYPSRTQFLSLSHSLSIILCALEYDMNNNKQPFRITVIKMSFQNFHRKHKILERQRNEHDWKMKFCNEPLFAHAIEKTNVQ